MTQAATEIFTAFPGQIFPFDLAAASAYANIVSHRDSLVAPIDGFDAQIAAICRTRAANLATRNGKDPVIYREPCRCAARDLPCLDHTAAGPP